MEGVTVKIIGVSKGKKIILMESPHLRINKLQHVTFLFLGLRRFNRPL